MSQKAAEISIWSERIATRPQRGFRSFLERHLVALVLALGAADIAALGLAIATRPFGTNPFVAIEDILPIPIYLMCAGLALLAAHRSAGRRRLPWAFFAAALLSYAAGDVIWAVYDVVLHRDPPFPSLADPFYLAFIPLFLAGILLLSGTRRVFGQYRTVFDAVIVAVAGAAVLWDALLQPIFAESTTGLAGTLTTAAYPAGDVILMFAAIVALRRQWRGRARMVLYTLVAGLFIATGADLAYARMVLDGTYSSGSLVDLGWPSGFLLVGIAAAMHAQRPVDFAAEGVELPPSLQRQLEPLTVTGGLVCWSGMRVFLGGLPIDSPLIAIVAVATVVSVLRYTVVVADTRSLIRGLDARLWRAVGRAR